MLEVGAIDNGKNKIGLLWLLHWHRFECSLFFIVWNHPNLSGRPFEQDLLRIKYAHVWQQLKEMTLSSWVVYVVLTVWRASIYFARPSLQRLVDATHELSNILQKHTALCLSQMWPVGARYRRRAPFILINECSVYNTWLLSEIEHPEGWRKKISWQKHPENAIATPTCLYLDALPHITAIASTK